MPKENKITLMVNGKKYEGWEEITVTKSIEEFCGGFSFKGTVTRGEVFPIKGNQECEVFIDETRIIRGWIEKVDPIQNSSIHTINISGRDRTNDIVDSQLSNDLLKSGNPPFTLEQLVQKVLDFLHLSDVKIINSFQLKKINEVESVDYGVNGFSFLQKYAQKRQILLTTDFDGNIVFTRAGTNVYKTTLSKLKSDPLTIQESNAEYDYSKRFHEYRIIDQGNNASNIYFQKQNTPKQVATIKASAFDNEIRRSRIYCLSSDDVSEDTEDVQERVNWEANFRRAQSEAYHLTIPRYYPIDDDIIWQPNYLIRILDPESGVAVNDKTLLITHVEYSKTSDKGSLTTLKLLSRDAFTTIVNKPQKVKAEETNTNLNFNKQSQIQIQQPTTGSST